MNVEERIARLRLFKTNLVEWRNTRDDKLREWLNENSAVVQRDVAEAGCLARLTISPPPAVGGLIMRNVNPFDMMFERIYLTSLIPSICDMLDKTVGVLLNPPPEISNSPQLRLEVQEGYAFVAMAMDIRKPRLRIDAIHLGGDDQAVHGSSSCRIAWQSLMQRDSTAAVFKPLA
jgi:hypothetical protein